MDIGPTLDLKSLPYTYTSHTNLIHDLRTAKTDKPKTEKAWKKWRSKSWLRDDSIRNLHVAL